MIFIKFMWFSCYKINGHLKFFIWYDISSQKVMINRGYSTSIHQTKILTNDGTVVYQFSWILSVISNYEIQNLTNICHYTFIYLHTIQFTCDSYQTIFLTDNNRNSNICFNNHSKYDILLRIISYSPTKILIALQSIHFNSRNTIKFHFSRYVSS